MKKETTLYTCMSDNIGQMRECDADNEVKRMIEQTGNPNWHKNYHPLLYIMDETDPNMWNPCPLIEGYCWVTCSK